MPNDKRVQLKTALIEARKSSLLTQSDVATRLKKPQSFVSKYEHGDRNLDLIEFLDVCRALDVNPHEIISTLENF